MKPSGLFFAAFIFLGGLLRFSSPSGAPPSKPAPHLLQEGSSQKAKPEAHTTKPPSPGPHSAFENALAESVAGYFGCPDLTNHPLNKDIDKEVHWNVPAEARGHVQFLIAIVPDPVHTHLALLFDRSIQSLQQAVQRQGDYAFDRSILPWKFVSHKDGDGVAERQSENLERKAREALPGLLIFRSNAPPSGHEICSSQRPLFVFLVAETPTSGIRTNQFQNALRIMHEIRSGVAESHSVGSSRLFVMGPNFSGSLDSLSRQLRTIPQKQKPSDVFVYSGSVTSAKSVCQFNDQFRPLHGNADLTVHFASFQENDQFSLGQFLRFVTYKGYKPEEIAVLSEDDTAYGNVQASQTNTPHSNGQLVPEASTCQEDDVNNQDTSETSSEIVHLHFPREISFFRSAYEKELAAKQDAASKLPGKTALSLNLEEEGTDDDAVAPYAGSQTSLSQEAVMLGVVSELQKHHIKFTILLATNPVDQLFLARYLRNSYPQGRVVVTQPDLLLLSQEDSLLEGVLGLNIYPLVPGQSDLLCDSNSPEVCRPVEPSRQPTKKQPAPPHQDRLFESSTNIGTFNAMVGLLTALKPGWSPPLDDSLECSYGPCVRERIPAAPYAEYASPCVKINGASPTCLGTPLTWLTILGQDGYWPIAALSDGKLESEDHKLPIFSSAFSNSPKFHDSSLLPVDTPALMSVNNSGKNEEKKLPPEEEEKARAHTTPAWNIVYCFCFVLLLVHAILSCTGTFLADSEIRAQFASTHDKFGVGVMAVGAFWLSTAFVLIMCARSPLVAWRGDGWLTPVLWAPLPIFVGFVLWDLWMQRKRRLIAAVLFLCVALSTTFQLLLAYDWFTKLPLLWSSRYIHFASEVSPIPPFLLLVAAGYWWVWMSLRGMSIVDLRRPRLPDVSTLGPKSFRMSDKDGEAVRDTAHPVLFAWRVLIVVVGVYIISLTVLDLKHPLQSLEGVVYDWGYSAALAFAIAVYLGCLVRLASTWFSYKQVLTGLDRSPLREAFSRMKRLTWKSMWNPGGSTLRETYRVMSRTFENLEKLEVVLKEETGAGAVKTSIRETTTAFGDAMGTYLKIVPQSSLVPARAQNRSTTNPSSETTPAAAGESGAQSARSVTSAVSKMSVTTSGAAAAPARELEPVINREQAPDSQPEQANSKKETKSDLLNTLAQQIETLQIKMADTAGFLIRDVLAPKWRAELEPVVSVDRRVKKAELFSGPRAR